MDSTCAARGPGSPGCACLNASTLARITAGVTYARVAGIDYPAFDGVNNATLTNATYYPLEYGLGCTAHDLHLEPYCTTQWCSDDEVVKRL